MFSSLNSLVFHSQSYQTIYIYSYHLLWFVSMALAGYCSSLAGVHSLGDTTSAVPIFRTTLATVVSGIPYQRKILGTSSIFDL
jgi:hypothetical protein